MSHEFDIQDIMELDVHNLAHRQYAALKNHATTLLGLVTKLIREDDYDTLLEYISFSPAGDDMGTEHHFIDFEINSKEETDIGDVIEKLKRLKTAMKGQPL